MTRRFANAHMTLLTSLVIGVVALLSIVPAARAEGRRNPLDGQPAVRHRLLLLPGRVELTPTFEATINADFRHTISGGLKLEYHMSDMFSFGALGLFGTSINTGLTDRIIKTLPTSPAGENQVPSQQQFEEHLNSMPVHGAVYATITPWYGKLAAFGKAFVAFDFYFSGGLAVAQLTNTCDLDLVCNDRNPEGVPDAEEPIPPDDRPNNDPPLNDGTQPGVFLGGGIHVFVNSWIALDLSFRDYWFRDNPSGLDFSGDFLVDKSDRRLLNHFFAGFGIAMFFPTKPDRTP